MIERLYGRCERFDVKYNEHLGLKQSIPEYLSGVDFVQSGVIKQMIRLKTVIKISVIKSRTETLLVYHYDINKAVTLLLEYL